MQIIAYHGGGFGGNNRSVDLAIEDNISLEVWIMDAPELFNSEQDWITSETRASDAAFHIGEGSGESFEVDGATVWYSVTAA